MYIADRPVDPLTNGGKGEDDLRGDAGNDWLTGGAGRDVFQLGAGQTLRGIDYVMDFVKGVDKIALSQRTFSGINRGDIAIVPTDAQSDFIEAAIVYSQATGSLFLILMVHSRGMELAENLQL
jgi:Ca2+-binding RTX toxin-like protein